MKPAKIRHPLPQPDNWQQLRWGAQFQSVINAEIQPWLSRLFGTHLIKIGQLSTHIDTSRCAISHQVKLSEKEGSADIIAESSKLPLTSKSVDACLLAHTLAWSQDPHQVLREVDRVLVDDGWMIISEFNPISLMGLYRWIPWIGKKSLTGARFFAPSRLHDWLNLLNYEVVVSQRTQVIPWRARCGMLTRHFPGIGCLTIILARKRTYPLTLEKKRAMAKGRCLRPVVNATRQYWHLDDQDADK